MNKKKEILTNKNKLIIKDIVKLYDTLCIKHDFLKEKIDNFKNNHKNYILDTDISFLLMQESTLFNLLEKEIKNLMSTKLNDQDTIKQKIQTSKSLFETWHKTLRKLDMLITQIQKNTQPTKQR